MPANDHSIDERILAILHEVAPDSIGIDIDPKISLPDQINFDSLDLLRFAHALETAFDVKIPALDYPRLATGYGAGEYIRQHLVLPVP